MCNSEYRLVLKCLPPLVLAAVAAAGAAGCKRSASEGPPAVRRADASGLALPASPCRTDTDCMLVDEGCCGCREGGRRVAIVSARLGDWQRARRCEEVMCIQSVSVDPSCAETARARCAAGRCEVGVSPESSRPGSADAHPVPIPQ